MSLRLAATLCERLLRCAFGRTRLHAAVAAMLALFVTACASSPKVAEEKPPAVKPGPDLAVPEKLADWLLAEDVAVIFRVEPSRAASLEAFLEGLGRFAPGVSQRLMHPREFADPVRSFEQRVGEGMFDELDRSRSSFLLLSSGVSGPLEACIVSGLPCPRHAYARPFYGRMILATNDPTALADKLEALFGEHAAVAEHGDYLRVEFFYNAPASDAGARAVVEKRASAQAPAGSGRLTPAAVEFLSQPAAFGLFLRFVEVLKLRAVVDAGETNAAFAGVARADFFRLAVASAHYSGVAEALVAPTTAEFEDATVLLQSQGDGGVFTRAVLTRTPVGAQIARAGFAELVVPSVAEITPLMWGSYVGDFTAMHQAAPVPEWVQLPGFQARLESSNIAMWTQFANVQHLTAMLTGAFEVGIGSPVASLWVAGRDPKHAETPEEEVPPKKLYRNAGATIFPATVVSRAQIEARVDQLGAGEGARAIGPIERQDGRLEMRVTNHAGEDDKWFLDEQETLSGSFVRLRMIADGSHFITGVLKRAANDWRVCCLPTLNELRWSVGFDARTNAEVLDASLYVGPQPIPEAPKMSTFDFEQIQPQARCLDKLHGLTKPYARRFDEALELYEEHLDSIADEFVRTADDCASSEPESAELARRAKAQLYWVRSQLAQAHGEEEQAQVWLDKACELSEELCA